MKTLFLNSLIIASLSALLSGCQSTECATNQESSRLIQSWVKTSGHSMHPLINDGDLVNVNAFPFENLVAGDIVVYENDNGILVSHRIYKRTKDTWFAKGDNNLFRDSAVVTRHNYRGLVYVEDKVDSSSRTELEGMPVNEIRRVVYTYSE